MYGKNWDRIIDIINVVKAECIDKEQIMSMLDVDVTWDFTVLDSLFFRKIITSEEYRKYLGKYNKRLEENVKYSKGYLKDAEEQGDKYNPYIHYALGLRSFGSVIDMLRAQE